MINLKTIFSVILLVILTAFGAIAQEKIGHANVELMLNYMPESKVMTQTIQGYQSQLANQMQTKEAYGQQKLQEVQEYAQQNPNSNPDNDAKMKAMADELQKLDSEIRQFAADSEQKLLAKRQSLMEPITEKLKVAIDKVAEAQGYTYIFNSVDGTGVSIILQGPEKNDLTRTILTELGVVIPEN